MTEDKCVFCAWNWSNLDLLEDEAVIELKTHSGEPLRAVIVFVRPLNPVTEGHVLVIHRHHDASAAEGPYYAGLLMHHASAYVKKHDLQANIITSIGPAATQTVFHTHTHIVPRAEGDGLLLPWSKKWLEEKK